MITVIELQVNINMNFYNHNKLILTLLSVLFYPQDIVEQAATIDLSPSIFEYVAQCSKQRINQTRKETNKRRSERRKNKQINKQEINIYRFMCMRLSATQ
jgi:hypothetical protein